MLILDNYTATGTQLKVERPGKATVISPCDSIEGPVVKLKDGSVVRVETEQKAKEILNEIESILFLGDLLISYGDFYNRTHLLVPPGYCEEWWAQELEKATVDLFGSIDLDKLSDLVELPKEALQIILKEPLLHKINAETAISLSLRAKVPLYPRYTYHWDLISSEDLVYFIEKLANAKLEIEKTSTKKIVLPFEEKLKNLLETIYMPHL